MDHRQKYDAMFPPLLIKIGFQIKKIKTLAAAEKKLFLCLGIKSQPPFSREENVLCLIKN